MSRFGRILLLILDACGVGELPDADRYGDVGSNTMVNTARVRGGLRLPNLERLGLGRIADIPGVAAASAAHGYYGKMAELSAGKDSTVGHWEIAGLISRQPFPLFPHGFPPELIDKFEKLTGTQVIGNLPASGTEIIQRLGEEHLRTRKLIVYTSADSVFQVAAHKRNVPLERLYEICRIARELLVGEWGVSRVIARPFDGDPGSFFRTAERKDFSIAPPSATMLNRLQDAGHEVFGIGKIEDLFAGSGLTRSVHTLDNEDGIDKTLDALRTSPTGLIFVNLVDFDMVWGHRNDVAGFALGLEAFDRRLPEILARLDSRDLLIITADHGCDPTTPSTDHSREYVPVLVYSPALTRSGSLGTRETFADVGQTICQNFALPAFDRGKGFLNELI